MTVIVLLIIIFIITILYGYYNFSYNINNFLTIKEGLDGQEIIVSNNSNNNTTNIGTEKKFIEFIDGISKTLYDSDVNNKKNVLHTQLNIDAIVYIIYNYGNVLSGFELDFSKLSIIYPNIIHDDYDKKSLYELILSLKSLQQLHINSLTLTKSDFIKFLNSNWCFYNSLLGYLNKFTNNILFFNNKKQSDKIMDISSNGDIESTMSYIYTPLPPTNSLIFYYPFYNDTSNYASGSQILDNNSYGNTSISNDDNKLYYLSLNNSYLSIDKINITKYGLTITCWFNYDSNNDNSVRLFDFGNNQIDIIAYSPGIGLYQPNITSDKFVGGGYLDNNWHYFALTISDKNWKLYIDYNDVITLEIDYPKLGKRTKNYIGKSNFGGDPNATGFIRDFRIYNRVLRKSEIINIKNLYSNIDLYTDDNGIINTGI
jgi:hypothetical protein